MCSNFSGNFNENFSKYYAKFTEKYTFHACVCKWVFGVLTHLVTSQRSFHVGSNVAMVNTRHAG